MSFIIECPYEECKQLIEIESINCGIFRHGRFKNGNEMDPHSSKELCDQLITENKIYGCGKPFKILKTKEEVVIEKCDYI